MSRKHFEVVRHFLQNARVGLLPVRRDRPRPPPARLLEVPRPRARPARARQPVTATSIRDYYRYLDDEIGSLLETADRRHGRAGRLGPRRPPARRRLLRQRVADPRGAARPEPLPRAGHAVRQARRELGPDASLERGGLLRPGLLQRQGARAPGRDRARRLRAVPRRDQGPVRGDHRRRRAAAGHARLQARGGLPRASATWPRT